MDGGDGYTEACSDTIELCTGWAKIVDIVLLEVCAEETATSGSIGTHLAQ